MVVDISHCGKQTTLDVTDVSSHPVTANHANAWRLSRNSRNKSDEELKAIAATGGVVGATPINRYFLQDSSRPATIDDFVAHIDYMVEKIGIDHVGVGTDGYMDGTERYDVDFSDKYMNSPERWKHVARKLHKMGYSKVDLQKILGLNFKRIYDQVLDP
jgi:membrane dipeptidase